MLQTLVAAVRPCGHPGHIHTLLRRTPTTTVDDMSQPEGSIRLEVLEDMQFERQKVTRFDAGDSGTLIRLHRLDAYFPYCFMRTNASRYITAKDQYTKKANQTYTTVGGYTCSRQQIPTNHSLRAMRHQRNTSLSLIRRNHSMNIAPPQRRYADITTYLQLTHSPIQLPHTPTASIHLRKTHKQTS